jgi:hypothetical protein
MLLILFFFIFSHQLFLNPVPSLLKTLELLDISEPDSIGIQRLLIQSRLSLNWYSTTNISIYKITTFPSIKARQVRTYNKNFYSALIANNFLVYDNIIKHLYNISAITTITSRIDSAYVNSALN